MNAELIEFYKSCTQCPRKCGVDRTKQGGVCGEKAELKIASAGLHFGEEPPVTVFGGSGTIFFTGCTLRCAFCQNYQISHNGTGREVSRDEFVRICLELEAAGAENINLVTPSHNIPLIADALKAAKDEGLSLPVAWNSSGYESAELLELLKGLADIYLPDFKTFDSAAGEKLFGVKDYPERAKEAVLWMLENAPLKWTEKECGGEKKQKLLSGVIIRHLFLPGRLDDTFKVLSWLKENADSRALISLMSQYTPVPFKDSPAVEQRRKKALSSFENRLVSVQEDGDLRDLIDAFDFEYLFYQDLSDDTSWLPDFTRLQPFSNALAKPLWHYSCGFIGK